VLHMILFKSIRTMLQRPMTYHSQHGEDRWIVHNCVLPDSGVFVEMGAGDGIELSNTYHFEQRGWTGLLIEPNPFVREALHRNRKCAIMHCAIGNPEESRPYFVHRIPGWSGFDRGGRQVDVEVKRLDTALMDAGITHIDLLSLDTEGTELEIWRTFDHRRWNPRIVIVEFDTVGLPSTEESTKHVFKSCDFQLIHRTKGNLIFQSLTVPPQLEMERVFDSKRAEMT
jgi:FkbM family methyltransferase